MRRSAGVTAAAIVAIVGSAFQLFNVLLALVFFEVLRPTLSAAPPVRMYAVVPGLVMDAGMAVWGIFTAIGLLRLRRWARYSALVFAGILVFVGILLLALAMAFSHFAPQGVPAQTRVATQVILSVIFLIPIGIGTWWLWMFNTARVKAQFAVAATEPPLAAISTALPVGAPPPVRALTEIERRRPVSITVIGWLLLVSSCMLPLYAFSSFPAFFMGRALTGWGAKLLYLAYGALGATLGTGLLKLKPLSRTLTIYFFLFGALQSLLFLLLPSWQSRLMASFDMYAWKPTPGVELPFDPKLFFRYVMWFGDTLGILGAAVQIWFLIRRKAAFYPR